jgi:DNA topoisomerase-3
VWCRRLQNGTIKLYKEQRCPLDNFELLLFSLGNQSHALGKQHLLCPCCYNNPPFEGMGAGKMGCDSCLHPTCAHGLLRHAICPCPGNAGKGYKGGGGAGGHHGGLSHEDAAPCPGILVLDPDSKPNWKLACNICNTLVRLHGTLHHIEVTHSPRRQCEECGSAVVMVEFHREKSPLAAGEVLHEGCMVCDELLGSLTELQAGRFKNVKLTKGKGKGAKGSGKDGAKGGGGGRGTGIGSRIRKEKKMDPRMTFDGF